MRYFPPQHVSRNLNQRKAFDQEIGVGLSNSIAPKRKRRPALGAKGTLLCTAVSEYES